MAINTIDEYIESLKERLVFTKTGAITATALALTSVFATAGNPAAGSLNPGNTISGIVPVDTDAGYPIIGAPTGDAYISKIEFGASVAARLYLFDRLFACGAFAFNTDTTLTNQPSYASRVPGGTDYKNLMLLFETVTSFTGNPSIQINYLDQDGNQADTGVVAIATAPIVGQCAFIPLAVGDTGVQRVDRIRGSVATAGTFAISVVRPLWQGRVRFANDGDVHDLLRVGMPKIFNNSALYVLTRPDGTSTGVIDISIEVASR